ncbi:MAG: MarR family winged helix-turn-helix transcriptional regulator [Pseudomonadota bacterium]
MSEPPVRNNSLLALKQIRMLVAAAKRHSQRVERELGISGAQLWALQEISDSPGLRVRDLAERLAIHQSTASNLVDALERKGLARKERTSEDQRVVRLYLGEEGRRLLARAPAPTQGVLRDALGALEGADLEQLTAVLSKAIGQLRQVDEEWALKPLPLTE